MFKKPFHVKTRSPLKGSERKAILEKVVKAHPLLSRPPATFISGGVVTQATLATAQADPGEEGGEGGGGEAGGSSAAASLVEHLLPKKGGVEVWKIQTHGESLGKVYCASGRPMFVEIDHDCLFPTVYALRMAPDAFTSLLTNDHVLERLQDGADLMLPGVTFSRPVGPADFRLGDLVGVTVKAGDVGSYPAGIPVAFGKAAVSSADVASTPVSSTLV